MFPSIQHGFSSGEMSPRLFGRTDLAKYGLGCGTLRNFYVDYRGGASSRAGLAYIGMCKQGASNSGGTNTTDPPRDIPFQFSINQGYALEFGDQYMRIKSDGAYVTEAATNITAATNANPLVITDVAHGYSNGDWVFISGMLGMTELNGLTWVVTNKTADTYHLQSLFFDAVNSTNFGVYTSGGTASRIYTVVAPYAAIDLPYLKFTQSADTMTLTCVNQGTSVEYPSYELVRNGATNWTFTADTFASSIAAPTGIYVTPMSSTTVSTYYSYVVTAVDATTGEESVASDVGTAQNNDIAINAGSNVITWKAVANASSYNVYASVPSYNVAVPVGSSFGYIGTAFGTQFTDTNFIADFTTVPPVHNNPFARSAITSLSITSSGYSYTQASVSYTITTSTGVGAVVVPVIVNSGVVAFIIQNGGEGYDPADTIAMSVKASGSFTFNNANPANGNNIVINGIVWTFTTGIPSPTQTKIQSTYAATFTQLVTDLNASSNPSINVATYTISNLSGGPIMSIIYKTGGTAGNAFTLAVGTLPGDSVSGPTLVGGSGSGGATAIINVGPATGTYPGTVAYFQQRRSYAYSLNNPNTYWLSQPGAFSNMDSSIPATDSDAITGAPWAQQINGIQFLVPMPGGLVVLTGKGAWQLNGGTSSAITPADQTATPQAYNGCHSHIAPIVVNYDILYVQAKGSIVRDLSYNFFANIYTGTDMTVLSEHLFNFHQLQQWAYAEEPFKIVWVVRDDGVMLSLTYLKEQDVYGWARHDTNGLFFGVCTVTEPPIDAIYCITKRYIPTPDEWVYYAERMDNRNWLTVEDSFCVDAGLSLPMTFPADTLTPHAADGTDNITSVNVITGGSGYTAPTATAVDATGSGTGATFTVLVSLGVITSITPVLTGSDYTVGSTTIEIADSTGSGAKAQAIITNIVTFDSDGSFWTSDMVGDVIRIGNANAAVPSNFSLAASGGGKAIITEVVDDFTVMANIIEPITNVVPNDPNNTPIPVSPNYWSVSTPVSSVTGLNHLEGMEVAILADGSVVANQTVTNGAITFPASYSAITIGLPFLPQLQTLYLDVPSQTGTIQGKRKNIQAVTARVESTRGISIGTNQPDASTQPNGQAPAWTGMIEMKQRNSTQPPGTAIPLFTGDLRELVLGNWEKPGQVAVQQNYPLPANILALLPEFSIGDTSG